MGEDYFSLGEKIYRRKGREPEAVPLYQFEPIAWVQSPFKGKHGVPRQPSLVPDVTATLKFRNDPDLQRALSSMEGFSHLWIIFVFHQHGGKSWKPSVRPPRLGGRQKVGVLASRSPHRPNPIGLSLGKLEDYRLAAEGGPELIISGVDMIDGTPVLDIKPYLSYADSVEEARLGWAAEEVKKYPLHFTEEALAQMETIGKEKSDFRLMMKQIIEIDPRPSFQKRKHPLHDPASVGLNYGIAIDGYEVKYQIQAGAFLIRSVELLMGGF